MAEQNEPDDETVSYITRHFFGQVRVATNSRHRATIGRMQIDPAQQTKTDNYKLLTNVVVPRPIAWVTSLGHEGIINLAPFSSKKKRWASTPTLQRICA